MRYPCTAFPFCLKTFGNGDVLRAHQLSCEHAQRKINNEIQQKEHARTIQYDYKINGMKGNNHYPTFSGLDHTQKLQLRDRYQFNQDNYHTNKQQYRRIRQPPDPNIVIIQTKSSSMDLSGYYT